MFEYVALLISPTSGVGTLNNPQICSRVYFCVSRNCMFRLDISIGLNPKPGGGAITAPTLASPLSCSLDDFTIFCTVSRIGPGVPGRFRRSAPDAPLHRESAAARCARSQRLQSRRGRHGDPPETGHAAETLGED